MMTEASPVAPCYHPDSLSYHIFFASNVCYLWYCDL